MEEDDAPWLVLLFWLIVSACWLSIIAMVVRLLRWLHQWLRYRTDSFHEARQKGKAR